MIAQSAQNALQAGKFHAVEVARLGDRLSLKVDGETVFEGGDPNPLDSGHLAFRIRGLNMEPAACLLRNLAIESR